MMIGDSPERTLRRCISENVRAALAEDVGSGDLTAQLIPEARQAKALVVTRETAVICGQPWFEEVFAQLDKTISIAWEIAEGQPADSNLLLCTVQGRARAILTGERSALNFLQLLSATATAARMYVDAAGRDDVTILDTRKTIPGLRVAQKYAVRCGGAANHRSGLFDAILIKENHIASAGDVRAAVTAARSKNSEVLVEIEAESLTQLGECLAAGADRVLLDNFADDALRNAVVMRNERAPGIKLEASGGITLENIRRIADTGVDYISVGALTKDIRAVDLSMRFEFID